MRALAFRRPSSTPLSRALCAAGLALAAFVSGCATPNPGATSSSVNREVAKLELKSRLADDAHWERVLALPRTHARFVALRDAIRNGLLSDDALSWYARANELLPKYPGVTPGNLYNYFVTKGLMRMTDAQAEGYLRSRAMVFARLNSEQCALYLDNKLPNREAWAMAAHFDDAEIGNYYTHTHRAFLLEYKNAAVRNLPSTADLGTVNAMLKTRFDDKAWGAGGERCKTMASWLVSFEQFSGSQRAAAMTLVLSVLSTPKPTAKGGESDKKAPESKT